MVRFAVVSRGGVVRVLQKDVTVENKRARFRRGQPKGFAHGPPILCVTPKFAAQLKLELSLIHIHCCMAVRRP